MKNLKYLVLIILLINTMFSCQDAYNIVQEGELNESTAITSTKDMQSYLNGIYANVSTLSEIGFTSIFTDETSCGRGSGGQNYNVHRFQLTAADGFASSIWYNNYETINKVNRLLESSIKSVPMPTDPADLDKYNSILAEARTLRAFCHFELLSYFSTNLKDDSTLGVILMNKVPKVSDKLNRNSNGEVFALIESDLQFAEDNIINHSVIPGQPLPYKYVSLNMINALRARMYLNRGKYTLAKQYAQNVISNAGTTQLVSATPVPANAPINGNAGSTSWNSSFYGNSSSNPYRKMFNDLSQGEVIFALDRPGSNNPWENVSSLFNTNKSDVSGSPLFEVGRNLFNLLKSNSGDIRRYANVDPTSLVNPNYATDANFFQNDVLVIDKYPGKTTSGYPLRNDIKVFRMSEMYLILAECYAKEGNFNGTSNSTASVLKIIRDARNFIGPQILPNYANEIEALKDVLLERRLELCFEGHRYLDLKRLGIYVGESINRDPTDDELSSLPTTISNTDYRFTLPIPTDEINANGVIQQNPGY